MRIAESGGVEWGGRRRVGATIRRGWVVALAFTLVGCVQSNYYAQNQTGTEAEVGKRPLVMANSEFAADLVTPLGIRVKTNGQYKTETARKTAARAIDR
ncbi:MAG TPA: hypothetical protein VGR40_02680, partial [Candidatus Binatus sp.]|nr:hypothetical protein [Candidatus Binatus sp.]